MYSSVEVFFDYVGVHAFPVGFHVFIVYGVRICVDISNVVSIGCRMLCVSSVWRLCCQLV